MASARVLVAFQKQSRNSILVCRVEAPREAERAGESIKQKTKQWTVMAGSAAAWGGARWRKVMRLPGPRRPGSHTAPGGVTGSKAVKPPPPR